MDCDIHCAVGTLDEPEGTGRRKQNNDVALVAMKNFLPMQLSDVDWGKLRVADVSDEVVEAAAFVVKDESMIIRVKPTLVLTRKVKGAKRARSLLAVTHVISKRDGAILMADDKRCGHEGIASLVSDALDLLELEAEASVIKDLIIPVCLP